MVSTYDFTTPDMSLGQFLEALGRALQKPEPVPGIGSLVVRTAMVDVIEQTGSTLKLSLVSHIELKDQRIRIGEKQTIVVPNLRFTKAKLEFEMVPTVDGDRVVLFKTE